MADYPFHYDMPALRDCDSEIAIQKAMRDMVAIQFRRTKVFAVPNAAKRTRWQAAQAKREGMTKGVCDLIVIGEPRLTAFVEVKAKAALEQSQFDFLADCVAMGHHAGVFRSVNTLVEKLREWGFQ